LFHKLAKQKPAASAVGTGRTGAGLPEITLYARHFDLALKRVPPSASENMMSVSQLRKWNREYGSNLDGRRLQNLGIGFEEASITPAVATATATTATETKPATDPQRESP
ncbi:hypothetical protein EV182_005023, partial [Spiromyces aspiralis]